VSPRKPPRTPTGGKRKSASEREAEVQAVLASLTPRERRLLELRFGTLARKAKHTPGKVPTYSAISDRTLWHEHFFSDLCRDETSGRFDAVETNAHGGGVYVLDVGARRVLVRCRTRDEASAAAQAAALVWRP
jgi:hypothetical protein